MSARQEAPKTFHATLEHSGNRLNWVIIRLPLDLATIWGKRGQIRVKGEINGFPLRTSLFPDGMGGHVMIVNKQMQRGGRARPGSTARFRLEPDVEERVVTVPPELARVLKESKRLRHYYESLNPSTRREISKMISQAKQPETRRRRAEQMAERLMEVMEAEDALPPLIERALAQNPRARAGWELMPPSHRRFHLFGIFHCRTPESRARRLAKAVEEMSAYAEERRR